MKKKQVHPRLIDQFTFRIVERGQPGSHPPQLVAISRNEEYFVYFSLSTSYLINRSGKVLFQVQSEQQAFCFSDDNLFLAILFNSPKGLDLLILQLSSKVIFILKRVSQYQMAKIPKNFGFFSNLQLEEDEFEDYFKGCFTSFYLSEPYIPFCIHNQLHASYVVINKNRYLACTFKVAKLHTLFVQKLTWFYFELQIIKKYYLCKSEFQTLFISSILGLRSLTLVELANGKILRKFLQPGQCKPIQKSLLRKSLYFFFKEGYYKINLFIGYTKFYRFKLPFQEFFDYEENIIEKFAFFLEREVTQRKNKKKIFNIKVTKFQT